MVRTCSSRAFSYLSNLVGSVPLLSVKHHLRCGFAHLTLSAHLLDLRGLFFYRRGEGCSFLLQLLHRLVLFDELVEQHRVHCVVAHGIDSSVSTASYQIGIYLFYILSHESKLRGSIRVNPILVMEGDWLEREDRFARLVHWLGLIL